MSFMSEVKNLIELQEREICVPDQRLGIISKQAMISANRKLLEYQELAICTYLNRLDKIGLPACLFMIIDYINGDHEGEGS
jgi:hypothetical protein